VTRTLLDQEGLEGWTRVQLRKVLVTAAALLRQLRDSLNGLADYQHSSPVLDSWKQCDYFQGIGGSATFSCPLTLDVVVIAMKVRVPAASYSLHWTRV
jgi:hypothetical protein